MKLNFTKMHGAGNDYVYVDCFQYPMLDHPSDVAVLVSDRNKGIGGDGLILIAPSDVADARMEMYNADGSRAEMCGNGIRCVAKYVFDHKIKNDSHLKIETDNGVLELELTTVDDKVTHVKVDLGEPILNGTKIPTTFDMNPVVDQMITAGGREFLATCVSMGNPHCVVYVDQLSDELVHTYGPMLENDSHFPNRVNIEFIEIVSDELVKQRTWERGSGETQACGTGAGAVCVAGVLSGRTKRNVNIQLLGGDLELEWRESDNHVYKKGPAVEVFNGVFELK